MNGNHEELEDENLVTGFGDEVLLFLIFYILGFLSVIVLYFWRNTQRAEDINDTQMEDPTYARRPPPLESDTCAICLNPFRFTLETNCGHRYCGDCLQGYYETDMTQLVCPLCRTQINLLYPCYTVSERNAESGSELFRTKERITGFVIVYNSVYSNLRRSFWSTVREIPILARHYFNQLFYGGQLTGLDALNLRIFLLMFFSNIYLVLPMDILPEAVFGILGWLDDILVFAFIIFYLSYAFRQLIVNNDFAG